MNKQELIQIRPEWHAHGNGNGDVNRWSKIHPRFEKHDGCIVDLGCLGWNKNFKDKTSDNWAGYFFDRKRVIGVDPQELPNEKSELFKGFISDFTGKANLSSEEAGHQLRMIRSLGGKYNVMTWKDFRNKFKIESIAILKINIEGSEWELIDSFDNEDLEDIDQICISFHNFLPQYNNDLYKEKTQRCVDKIIDNNYTMIDLGIYGWKVFLKKV
tara:strand:- start:13239 stop:13880 length:642 start_codon:yes stop_codon:yes gene_type:complete